MAASGMWQYIAAKSFQSAAQIYGQIDQDSRSRAGSAYQAGILENNAVLAEWDAYNTIQAGVLNIQKFKENFSKMQGSARVAAASGNVVVNEGSALDILVGNAGEAAKEEVLMRYETEAAAHSKYMEAVNYRQQAALTRASAPSDLSTAIGVLGSVAGAAGSIYAFKGK